MYVVYKYMSWVLDSLWFIINTKYASVLPHPHLLHHLTHFSSSGHDKWQCPVWFLCIFSFSPKQLVWHVGIQRVAFAHERQLPFLWIITSITAAQNIGGEKNDITLCFVSAVYIVVWNDPWNFTRQQLQSVIHKFDHLRYLLGTYFSSAGERLPTLHFQCLVHFYS